MLKANFKSAFFFTLVSTVILLAGCNSSEEKKAAQIEEAQNLVQLGAYEEALLILDELTAEYPNDVEVLKSMGRLYAADGDPTMAAFFLEQAHLQSPGDSELLLETYQSLEAANQPSGNLLEKLSAQSPEVMTPQLWIRLGQIRQSANQVQPALEAYLQGVDPEKTEPAPETAVAIGQLFVQAGNLPQAEKWLKSVAEKDDPMALTALFGLLEINLRNKNWSAAEANIARLDEQFPGAVDASQWQQARQELNRWRKDQDAMKAELARAEKKETPEVKPAATPTPPTPPTPVSEAAATTPEPASMASNQTNETVEASEPSDTVVAADPIAEEGKSQVIADIEAAEAMANTPAIAAEGDGATMEDSLQNTGAEDSGSKMIAFDPNIAIEPADPEISFEVSYDQAPIAGEAIYSIDNSEPVEDLAPAVTFPYAESGSAPAPPIAVEQPQSIEELLADAEVAEIDRDFKSAIRKYWAAISIDNTRADIWNLLSRSYLVDGQLNNAEVAALEAVRLNPSQVAYTLDYLRVTQRSKEATEFLRELETAYARFPSSPEITLSLARAHERISKQRTTARTLYLRFIDIAPNHPLVPEAQDAAARLM